MSGGTARAGRKGEEGITLELVSQECFDGVRWCILVRRLNLVEVLQCRGSSSWQCDGLLTYMFCCDANGGGGT